MSKIDSSSIHLRVPNRQRKNVRATDLVNEVAYRYSILKKNLGDDQAIDLTCCIGGNHYPVANLQPYSEECVFLVTTSSDGIFHAIFCPVEQMALFITLSPKMNDEPPREIGFAAIEKEHEKAAR